MEEKKKIVATSKYRDLHNENRADNQRKVMQDVKVSRVQKYKLEKKKEKISDKIKKKTKKIIEKIKKVKKENVFKVVIVSLVFIALIIALIFFIRFIADIISINRYKIYEKKMNEYGFSKLYDNGQSNSREKITKLEALKLAICASQNIDSLSGIAINYTGYEGQSWIEYATFFGIIDTGEIFKDNKDDEVQYLDLVRYFYNAKKAFIDDEVKGTKSVVIANAAQYSNEIQVTFADLVERRIIKVETSNIDASQVATKYLANELVINTLEQLSTISTEKEKVRMTELPSNSDKYPYVLFDIDQKIYNYDLKVLNKKSFKTPKDIYADYKEYYSVIKEGLEGYFTQLYSVDCENIDFNKIYEMLEYIDSGTPTLSDLKEYVDYVKEHKIKINSEVKFIEPCLYFDGENYRVRTEIKLNILQTDTRDNLLFGDSNYGTVKYNKNEYTIYVDVKLTIAEKFAKVYIYDIYGIANEALNKNQLDVKLTENVNK